MPTAALAVSTVPTRISLIQATKAVETSRVITGFQRLARPWGCLWGQVGGLIVVTALGERVVEVAVGHQAEEQGQKISQEERDGDGQAELVFERGLLGTDQAMKDRRHEHGERGEHHHRRSHTRGCSVEALYRESDASCQQTRPQDEQDVADDASSDRRLDHLIEPGLEGKHRDDQLRGIPECGIEQPADARSHAFGDRLGRRSDLPCQRDDRRRREHEDDKRGGVEKLGDDRRRYEDEQEPEQPELPRVEPAAPGRAARIRLRQGRSGFLAVQRHFACSLALAMICSAVMPL